MNKLLIEILQRIPEDATPTIEITLDKSGVDEYLKGYYVGEKGYLLSWRLENKLTNIFLYVFKDKVFYQIDDYNNAECLSYIPFNLEEFVKHFDG